MFDKPQLELDVYDIPKDLSANGGYKALDRSYYFYPWDDSSKRIFSEVYKYWRYIKVLAGLKYDTYWQVMNVLSLAVLLIYRVVTCSQVVLRMKLYVYGILKMGNVC